MQCDVVVIASGDYSASAEMKLALISAPVADTEAVNVFNTGDGQRMALESGRLAGGHAARL